MDKDIERLMLQAKEWLPGVHLKALRHDRIEINLNGDTFRVGHPGFRAWCRGVEAGLKREEGGKKDRGDQGENDA